MKYIEKKEPASPEAEKAVEPVEDMSDFNKPKIIQPQETGPAGPEEKPDRTVN